MLEVGQLTASLELMSLFGDAIRLTDVRAEDAQLWFEWTEQDAMNWVFRPDKAGKRDAPPAPLPLLLERARLDNATLHFSHPALTDTLIITIPRAMHQADAQHNLTLDGLLNVLDRPLSLTGTIGPFPELAVAGSRDHGCVVGAEGNWRYSKGPIGALFKGLP